MTIAGSVPAPRVLRRPRHIVTNFYIGPSRNSKILEIWGYSDRLSYAPGEVVSLHVSTTADRYDVEIGRDGARYRTMRTWANLPGHHHDTPRDCSVIGCDWPVELEFVIPDDWPSGGYLLTLRGHRGAETVEEHHLIIVRGGAEKAQVLLLCATSTWVAYNCWGGSNAFDGLTGPDGRQFSPVLSTQRPWTRGFCRLPEGAPRTIPDAPLGAGNMVRYPFLEWAYAHGYSKRYASAGWASYERHFVCWAEEEGFALDVATLHDLDADPDLLKDYQCAVIVGHDEYWSRNMRLTMDNWIETGGRLARFAGNFLWQIRLEDDGRRQICHKHTAREKDPVQGTDRRDLLTTAWEAQDLNWPGAQTVGVNGARGVYAGLGNCVGRGSGGFTIYRPGHWAFDQTYLGYGDVLGSASRIYGSEVDGLDHVIEDGLPYTTGEDGAAEEITILGLGLGSNAETDHGIWGEHLYVGDAQVAWKAETIFGAVTADTMDRASRGNGVIVHWPRKRGEVFTAATCEWVMGLKRRDPQVEQVTRNVLRRFCDYGV